MSKRAKIITGIVTAVIVVAVLIIGIVLATGNKFDMANYDTVQFNDHTSAFKSNISEQYNLASDIQYYSGGTRIVTPKDNVYKFGVYSHTQQKLVVPTIYDEFEVLANRVDGEKSYFLFKSQEHKNELNLYDHNGNKINILNIDKTSHKTMGQIMVKDISYSDDNNSIIASIKNKHIQENIIVTDISYEDSYYMEDMYHYEVWSLEDENGAEYNNLYKVNNGGDRELIQTLNGTVGHLIDSNTGLSLKILNSGTPLFLSGNLETPEGLTVYDIDYKKKGVLKFNENLLQYPYINFSLGNDFYYQFLIPTNEENYEFSRPNSVGILEYYQVRTFKIDLVSAEIQKSNVEFIIHNATYINPRTTLAKIQYIEDETLGDIETVLINNKFQILEIDYEFESITKLNDKRYLAHKPNSNIYYIIDEEYKLISTLNNYQHLFTTNNAIIFSDNTQQYVCNFDGIIMNKYKIGTIENIHNKDYYLVTKSSQDENDPSIEITKYYIENLGFTKETPLHTSVENTNTYTYKNTQYDLFEIYKGLDNGEIALNVMIRGKIDQDNATMTYQFYSMNDTLLYTLPSQPQNASYTVVYSDANFVILNFNTNLIVFDR